MLGTAGVKALPQCPQAEEMRAYRGVSGKYATGLEMKGPWY